MTKKRFVEFYLTAMMRAVTDGRVLRLAFLYEDLAHKETVTVYREDGPQKVDVTGMELLEVAAAVVSAEERERERESCRVSSALRGANEGPI